MAKPPTPHGISRFLATAGFTRSVERPSRIRGLRDRTEGFYAEKWGEGEVRVFHATGSDRGENAKRRTAEGLERYAEALRGKGYTVEQTYSAVAVRPCLTVKAPADHSGRKPDPEG